MTPSTHDIMKFEITFDVDEIPRIVERIKECHGLAFSAFSGCPISLTKSLERRGESRVKFDEPIYLYPVELNGNQAISVTQQPIVGITRDISPHGVGFAFDEAIETDYVIAEFDLYGAGQVALLLDVRWQRQTDKYAFIGGALIIGRGKQHA
ncbi:hypothetical protein AB1L42_14745 [Thalassoglobus sp. JC818]|uniref:hypothetical protein n=1 Tax=Thalassoglobus sp. JC818 TaxID=3232136 RepID=UPI0034583921